MATARASRAVARPAPGRAARPSQNRPAQNRPAQNRPDLRVVPARRSARSPRLKTVKQLMAAMTVIGILTFSAVVALHALHVQVQVEIDGVRSENAELETVLVRRLAELTEHDSPQGLVEAARGQGLVEARDVVMLSPVADGLLGGPSGADPFTAAG